MTKLIFIYNKDSGLFNSLSDYAHKTLKPETYKCNLCKLTYNLMSLKNEWKSYMQALKVDYDLMHKDEFQKKFSINSEFPAILMEKSNKISILISAKEINSCKNIEELKSLLKKKLS